MLSCQEVKQAFLIFCQHGRDSPLRASAARLSGIDYPSTPSRRTTSVGSRAGWEDVIAWKPGMPALSAATAGYSYITSANKFLTRYSPAAYWTQGWQK